MVLIVIMEICKSNLTDFLCEMIGNMFTFKVFYQFTEKLTQESSAALSIFLQVSQ